jgi:hypothetical protein
MTWTAVGGLNPNATHPATTTTFSFTPSTVGDLVCFVISQTATTGFASALSSTNVTWTAVTHVVAIALTGSASLFQGVVTATGAATVTITWSGTAPSSAATIDLVGQEFASTAGSWSVDTSTTLNSTGTATWPSMTAAHSGELYFGYAINTSSAVAGSTSGFVFIVDADTNGVAYSLGYVSGAAPVWGDSGQAAGVLALFAEPVTPPPAGPPMRNQPAVLVTGAGWRGAQHSR